MIVAIPVACWVSQTPNTVANIEGDPNIAEAQLIRYMDDCSLRYGWVTTHENTRVVKRIGQFTFLVSPILNRNEKSTPTGVSVKEALLFMAIVSQADWHYPKVGDNVVSSLYAPWSGFQLDRRQWLSADTEYDMTSAMGATSCPEASESGNREGVPEHVMVE
jgi:hypothetical protein